MVTQDLCWVSPEKEIGQDGKIGLVMALSIMLGYSCSVGGVMAGDLMAAGYTFRQFVIAVFCGSAVLALYAGAMAYMGSRNGLTTHMLAKYTFGSVGAKAVSAVLAIVQTGWFALVVAAVAVITTNQLMSLHQIHHSWFFMGDFISLFDGEYYLPVRLLATVMLVLGLLMTAFPCGSIKSLSLIGALGFLFILVCGGALVIGALFSSQPDTGYKTGLDAVRAHFPATSSGASPVPLITASGGAFFAAGTCTPDLMRFAGRSKAAAVSTAMAVLFGNTMAFVSGAVFSIVYGTMNLPMVLLAKGLMIVSIFVLLMNAWAFNSYALYSAALGGNALVRRIPPRVMLRILGVIGAFAAFFIYGKIMLWLDIMSVILPPVGTLMVYNYYVVNDSRYPPIDRVMFNLFNIPALTAWVFGTVTALFGMGWISILDDSIFDIGIPAFNSMIATVIWYAFMQQICPFTSRAKQDGRRL